MNIEIQISLDKRYKKWYEEYGKEFVDASISNELQLYADNINEDVLKGHKEIYSKLLKESK